MKKNNACFTSDSIHWGTPSKLYKAFLDHGYIDPCPLHADKDGLKVDYINKKLYINPPFKDLDKWVDYAYRQFDNGCDVTILMPSRTDTKYFHKLADLGPFIYFIKGRLNFNDVKNSAPFPTILVCLKQRTCSSNWFACTVDEFIKYYL